MAAKVCPHCCQALTLCEFAPDHRYSMGVASWCRRCSALVIVGYGREYQRRQSHKHRTKTGCLGAEHRYATWRQWSVAHPGAHRANVKVGQALLRGDLAPKPCETCGAQAAVAHHDDYAQPLRVRWLCRPHHAEVHGRVKYRKIIAESS